MLLCIKTIVFSKSAVCVSKLAMVLLSAPCMGVIQHAAVPLAVQVVRLRTKTMQFPSYEVEKSWGPSPLSKGNFFISCPKYDIPIIPASSYVLAAKSKHVGQMGRSNTERGSVMKIHFYTC